MRTKADLSQSARQGSSGRPPRGRRALALLLSLGGHGAVAAGYLAHQDPFGLSRQPSEAISLSSTASIVVEAIRDDKTTEPAAAASVASAAVPKSPEAEAEQSSAPDPAQSSESGPALAEPIQAVAEPAPAVPSAAPASEPQPEPEMPPMAEQVPAPPLMEPQPQPEPNPPPTEPAALAEDATAQIEQMEREEAARRMELARRQAEQARIEREKEAAEDRAREADQRRVAERELGERERKLAERRKAEKIAKERAAAKARAASVASKGVERARFSSGAVSASRGDVMSYAATVRARVAANKPTGLGTRGSVTVSFAVSRSGGLAYASIARSSGSAALDHAALSAVRRAAPFPAPPEGAGGSALAFSVPFHFN